MADQPPDVRSNYEKVLLQNWDYTNLPKLNPNIMKMKEDFLYHIALGTSSHDLPKMFGDTKFVVMGGTPQRMENFAYYIMNEIGYELPSGTILNNISKLSHRYALFKVGPVLSVSHGMGMPSIGILLNELVKLMYHSKAKDPMFIRLGTSGGFNVPAGSVIVTEKVFNDYLQPFYEMTILGEVVKFPGTLNKAVVTELRSFSDKINADVRVGSTFCSDSFYEGSGRCDGAICEFTPDERHKFYKKLQNLGIVNTEMESLAFAALTNRAGIKSAVVTVTLSDRLLADQIKQPREVLDEWQMRPFKLVSEYIKSKLHITNISAPISTKPAPQPNTTLLTCLTTPENTTYRCPNLAWSDSAKRNTTEVSPKYDPWHECYITLSQGSTTSKTMCAECSKRSIKPASLDTLSEASSPGQAGGGKPPGAQLSTTSIQKTHCTPCRSNLSSPDSTGGARLPGPAILDCRQLCGNAGTPARTPSPSPGKLDCGQACGTNGGGGTSMQVSSISQAKGGCWPTCGGTGASVSAEASKPQCGQTCASSGGIASPLSHATMKGAQCVPCRSSVSSPRSGASIGRMAPRLSTTSMERTQCVPCRSSVSSPKSGASIGGMASPLSYANMEGAHCVPCRSSVSSPSSGASLRVKKANMNVGTPSETSGATSNSEATMSKLQCTIRECKQSVSSTHSASLQKDNMSANTPLKSSPSAQNACTIPACAAVSGGKPGLSETDIKSKLNMAVVPDECPVAKCGTEYDVVMKDGPALAWKGYSTTTGSTSKVQACMTDGQNQDIQCTKTPTASIPGKTECANLQCQRRVSQSSLKTAQSSVSDAYSFCCSRKIVTRAAENYLVSPETPDPSTDNPQPAYIGSISPATSLSIQDWVTRLDEESLTPRTRLQNFKDTVKRASRNILFGIQPDLVKCPRTLQRLEDECRGYE